MTTLSQPEALQVMEAVKSTKEEENGGQEDVSGSMDSNDVSGSMDSNDVSGTMDSNDMGDSGIQTVPSMSDADNEWDEVEDFYPQADVKNEEESCLEAPESEQMLDQIPDSTVEQSQNTVTAQYASHVVVCSSGKVDDATTFQYDLAEKSPNADVVVIACNVKEDFETLLTAYTTLEKVYILVDSSICDAMFNKRKLHTSIDELFEKLVETTTVYLVKKVQPEEDVKYVRLKTQLPECVLEHKEICVSTENRAILEQLQTQDQQENLQTGANSTGNNTQIGTDPLQKNNIMIGSKCKMNIEKSDHQLMVIRQDGSQNIVNVQIVPTTTTSRLHVVITTHPSDPELERTIVHEVKDDEQFINICLTHFEGKLILIDQGSIIIELDIQPGRTIGFQYIQDVLTTIFQGNITKLIPEGSTFSVDAHVHNAIPMSKLQEYFSGYVIKDEDLHVNCVNKQKYEDAVRELEIVTRKLEDLRRNVKHVPDCLKVTIVSGDITEEKTDVVVNSTNAQLMLAEGDLSGDILKAAGPSIQAECRKQNPSKLKVGDLAVTGGGNLACKEIYHVILSDTWSTRQQEAERSLKTVLNKCLKRANKSEHGSISFPALGMGKLQYDPETVVPLMYDVIMKFRPTTLKEVRFVILPKFKHIHEVFNEKERHSKHMGRSFSEPADLTYGKQLSLPKADFEEELQVKWVQGDISSFKVDVVVNTTDKRLNLKSGPISQAVLKAAGTDVQLECNDHYPDGIAEGQLAITSGGRLCNYIFHTSLWPWTDQFSLEKGFVDLIGSILKEARDKGQRSIAFPMLGTGTLKYPPEEVAGWLTETFAAEKRRSSSLREIFVVVHPKDTKNIEVLKDLAKLPESKKKTGQFY